MVPHNPVTIVAELIPDQIESLRAELKSMGKDPAGNTLIPFSQFETVHFARLFINDRTSDPDGKTLPPQLIFLAIVDGSAADFIEELARNMADGVDRIFEHCKSYPNNNDRDKASRFEFLHSRNIRVNALYINTIGRSAKQIVEEASLRDRIHGFLDTRDWSSEKPEVTRQAIVDWVFSQQDLEWARAPAEKPSLVWKAKEKLRFSAIALALTVLGIVFLPLIVLAVLIIRFQESRDAADTARPPLDKLVELRSREDFGMQNQFTAIGFLKPGILRYWTPRIGLFLVQFSSRHIFNRGNLAGIPLLGLDGVDTIHFARWCFLSPRQMLFASNYDGSLESYMGDFVDKIAWGLNFVFSNGLGWPRTRWLILDGANDEERFKDFIRIRQIDTQCWYSLYPRLSTINIANNESIRSGLYGTMDTAKAKRWLQKL